MARETLSAGLTFTMGMAAGIVGAAGAFILVPIMLTVLKISTRKTIATSLAITFISSIGSTFGKLLTAQVLDGSAAVMVIASTRFLQWLLTQQFLGTAIKN